MKNVRMSAVALLALSALALPVHAADTTATVKGVVYNADHKPVPKATVRLLHRDKGEKKLSEVDTVSTDADGEFRFGKVDNGTYVIVAQNRGGELRDRSEITIHDGRDPEDLSFTIRPGKEAAREEVAAARSEKQNHVNLVGQVVDKSGDALTGVTIKLLTGDADAKTDKMVTVDTTTSEKKGRFEFYKVTFGHYIVEATKGKLSAREEVTLKDTDGTQSLQLKLK